MTSWKTTMLGILTILSALSGAMMAYLQGHPVDFPTLIAAITAGIGLLQARDHTVSDLQAGAK